MGLLDDDVAVRGGVSRVLLEEFEEALVLFFFLALEAEAKGGDC